MSKPFQRHSDSRETRIAINEDLCRDLNERKAAWIADGQLTAGFRCECWRLDCNVRVSLCGDEWRRVRECPNRFAVAPGHIASENEKMIEDCDHFWIIEKQGEAGEVAEELA